MRMGKMTKKRRSPRGSADPPEKPSRMGKLTVVGQVSPNVIASVLWAEMLEKAEDSVERHAAEWMKYEDEVARIRNESNRSKEAVGDDAEGVEEAEIDADGNVVESAAAAAAEEDLPPLPTPPGRNVLFTSQHTVDELLETVLQPTSRHFTDKPKKSGEYKAFANAAKFERLLDEKYGRLRPFIESHPEVEQAVRNFQRKWAKGYFSPFRKGEGPIGKSTSVVLLFMMQRNKVRWEAILLAAVFLLVGLQPWALVTLVAFCHNRMENRKRRRVGGFADELVILDPYYEAGGVGGDVAAARAKQDKEREKKRKHNLLREPVGMPLSSAGDFAKAGGNDDGSYDSIIVGSGPDALFSAALLARTGRSVLVLSEDEDASGCRTLTEKAAGSKSEWASVPFDTASSNASHIGMQQKLLAPAVCTVNDAQGGARFARVGTRSDGFAHAILQIPGVGVEGGSGTDEGLPFVLRAGGREALAQDASQYLGDGWPGEDGKVGNSSSSLYTNACESVNASASEYYLSKVLPDSVYALRSKTSYQESSIRFASGFLDKFLPLNAHVRSLLAGVGMKDENLPPGRCSMAPHVSNVCASIGPEGMCYPVGGPRALCKALEAAIVQCGGKIVTGVAVKNLLFEEKKDGNGDGDKGKKKAKKAAKAKEQGEQHAAAATGDDDNADKPRVVGVTLADSKGTAVKVHKENGAVVSHVGFIPTYIRLLPDDVRNEHGVPRGLPALSERRPLMQVLVGLRGNADELSVTGADFYRLPNARIATDEVDEITGQVKMGEIGSDGSGRHADDDEAKAEADGEDKDIDATGTDESSSGTGSGAHHRGKRSRGGGKKHRFDRGVSWMKVSFPSAKDPSWCERYLNMTTCVVTVEAEDEFVTMFDTKPKVYSIHAGKVGGGEAHRMVEKVMRDLLENFPQLEGKVECAGIRGPYRAGLSHGPERYAAKGVRADGPYPGLYVGGSELTVGDSYSASMVGSWLAANAVVGYSFIDHLYLHKNITTDLEQFLDEPTGDGTDEDDVAVPYEPKEIPDPPNTEKSEEKPAEGEEEATAAESSKEE